MVLPVLCAVQCPLSLIATFCPRSWLHLRGEMLLGQEDVDGIYPGERVNACLAL